MWDWHAIAIKGYPGWDMEGEAPPFMMFDIVSGDGLSSHEIASKWDDLAESHFYYRDWTDNNIPFVRDGDVYRTGFWFQRRADRERFAKFLATMQAARKRDHVLSCYAAAAALETP